MTTTVGMVILGPKEVAARLGCSVRTVTRILKQGALVGWQIGPKQWRITEAHLELYITESIRRQREQLGFLNPKPTTPGLSVTGRDLPPEASLLGPIRTRKLA